VPAELRLGHAIYTTRCKRRSLYQITPFQIMQNYPDIPTLFHTAPASESISVSSYSTT